MFSSKNEMQKLDIFQVASEAASNVSLVAEAGVQKRA